MRPRVQTVTTIEFDLPEDGIDLPAVMRHLELSMVKQALAQAKGNRAAAARLLGLNRTTLVAKVAKFGLDS